MVMERYVWENAVAWINDIVLCEHNRGICMWSVDEY